MSSTQENGWVWGDDGNQTLEQAMAECPRRAVLVGWGPDGRTSPIQHVDTLRERAPRLGMVGGKCRRLIMYVPANVSDAEVCRRVDQAVLMAERVTWDEIIAAGPGGIIR